MFSLPLTFNSSLTVVFVTLPSASISTYTDSFFSESFEVSILFVKISSTLLVFELSVFSTLFFDVVSLLSSAVLPQPVKLLTVIDATSINPILFFTHFFMTVYSFFCCIKKLITLKTLLIENYLIPSFSFLRCI